MYLPTISNLLTSRAVSRDLHQQWRREAARQRALGKRGKAAFCLGICARERDLIASGGRRIRLLLQQEAPR